MYKIHGQNPVRETAVRILAVVASATLAALNYNTFVQAGDLFPGGFSGLTRLLQRSALEYFQVELPFAPVNLLFNAVPAAVSFLLVGRRFTLYSCMVIILSSILTDLFPPVEITEDPLLVSVFGGMLGGVAGGICLKARIAAGGTDFIAIALSERKNVEAWNYILAGNACMLAVAGALFGWDTALYSIIFQFVSTQVYRMMDPDRRRSTMMIVTGRETAGGVCAQIQEANHTATLVEGVGLYSGSPCVVIYSVVSGSQVRRLTRLVRESDPKAFVDIVPTEKLAGNFYRPARN